MILNKAIAENKMRRMALEIAERNQNKNALILIGIKENGIFIAQKIKNFLAESFNGTLELIELSLDKKNPIDIQLSSNIDLNGASVLLIDDVANSGRTMLYALKPLLNQFPAQIETLVLVERTYKKFPIDVNYVGMSLATTKDENIIVEVQDGEVMGAHIGGL
jgi:pyrimidine operon attenuation protein/uracil phosphoribosyltransferase